MTLESEFEALFYAHQGAITGYLCNLLGDAERGQALAQETFLRAYRALAWSTQVEHPRAGLYRIATNAANDHFRRVRLVRRMDHVLKRWGQPHRLGQRLSIPIAEERWGQETETPGDQEIVSRDR